MKEDCRERLVIFTRYPEPGTTKTRMIPKLGAESAADLQRRCQVDTVFDQHLDSPEYPGRLKIADKTAEHGQSGRQPVEYLSAPDGSEIGDQQGGRSDRGEQGD